MIEANSSGAVFSVEKVADELLHGTDELVTWAEQRDSGFFLNPTEHVVTSMRTVAVWVARQQFDRAAIDTFLQAADYYLVAHAHAGNHTVVTHERVGNSVKKIKIPNVCVGLGVAWASPFDMLQNMGARFVLAR